MVSISKKQLSCFDLFLNLSACPPLQAFPLPVSFPTPTWRAELRPFLPNKISDTCKSSIFHPYRFCETASPQGVPFVDD